MSLKPYLAHKDSGVPWLGDIPLDWDVARTRFVCDIGTGDGDTVNAIEGGDYPFYVRSETVEASDSFTFDGESVLTAGDGAGVGKIFHRADGKFRAHQRVYVLNRFRGVSRDFFYYYFSTFLSKVVLDGSAKSTVDSIRRPMVANLWCAVPPSAEQLEIGKFLDRETAEIDAFIADQEELIALLAERRAAIFGQHFDQVVRVADSGLKKKTKPFGSVITETDRRIGSRQAELLSVSIHHGVVGWSEMHDNPPRAAEFSSYRQVDVDDIVLNRMRAFQGAAGRARQAGMVSPDYAVFKIKPGFDSKYVELLFRSRPFLEAIKLRLRGIGDESSGAIRTPRINVRDLVRIEVAMPGLDAQQQLLHSLGQESALMDSAVSDAREAIALSKERRAALISAAVTGKIDVRNHGGVE